MNVWADRLLSALAEAIAVGRLAFGIARQVDPGIPGVWVFLVALAAHVLGQVAAVMATRRSEDGDRRVLLALWAGPGLAVAWVAVRAFAVLGYGGILIYTLTWILSSARGIGAVTRPTGSDGAKRGLVGGTILLGLASLAGLDGGVAVTGDILVYALLCTAMMVLRRRREVAGQVSTDARTPWMAGGLGSVLLILAAVLILYAVGTGGFATFVRVLVWCRDFVAMALAFVLTPFAYLVHWLIVRLQRLFAGRELEAPEAPVSLGEELARQMRENPELARMPEWLKWCGIAFVLVSALWVAWIVVSRFYRGLKREPVKETRASLVEGGAAKEWLDGLTNGLKGLVADASSRLRSLAGWEPATLDEIYAATLAALARKGMRREAHFTPIEYYGHVMGEMPDPEAGEALATITVIFTECHYSQRVPLAAELQTMKDAYRRLRS